MRAADAGVLGAATGLFPSFAFAVGLIAFFSAPAVHTSGTNSGGRTLSAESFFCTPQDPRVAGALEGQKRMLMRTCNTRVAQRVALMPLARFRRTAESVSVSLQANNLTYVVSWESSKVGFALCLARTPACLHPRGIERVSLETRGRAACHGAPSHPRARPSYRLFFPSSLRLPSPAIPHRAIGPSDASGARCLADWCGRGRPTGQRGGRAACAAGPHDISCAGNNAVGPGL